MNIRKNQLQRLVRIAALLKENRYPNAQRLIKDFSDRKGNDGSCSHFSRMTISRDIKLLREEFDCPLGFDYKMNGYYLKHHGWRFTYPKVLNEDELLASVLGARIAECIFPEPLKSRIRDAVDYILTEDNPDFLDTAAIGSLTIFAGLNIDIDEEVFLTIFECWQKHEAVKVLYSDANGSASERIIEPHALVYYECFWYTKCFCHKRGEIRIFAIHRISKADKTGRFFELEKKITTSIDRDTFLQTKRLNNVEIRCHNSIKSIALTQPLHTKQKMINGGSDYFILKLPKVVEFEAVNFVMRHFCKAKILNNEELKKKVIAAANQVLKEHCCE